MIRPDYSKWDFSKNLEMLAYFANLIDELSFNYTTDSFKAPALNVISLMEEAIDAFDELDNGIILEGALHSIIEELRFAITNDRIFLDVLADKGFNYIVETNFFNNQYNKKDLKSLIQVFLSNTEIHDEYLLRIKSTISDLIKNTNHKKEVEELSRLMITQLRNVGYSEEFIYHINRKYFFSSNQLIDSPDIVDGFLDIFNCKENDFVVYFIANPIFDKLKAGTEYVILDKEDPFFKVKVRSVVKFRNELGTNIVLAYNVKAMDLFSARLIALSDLRDQLSYFKFFHHNLQCEINDNECIVFNSRTKRYNTVKSSTPSILRCKDNSVADAISRHNFLKHQSYNEESSYRLFSSLKMHGAALKSSIQEDQFINLFTALEILVPKDSQSGHDRIMQIYNTIIPYLCTNYYHKLVKSTLDSLLIWNKDLIEGILAQVTEGTSQEDKLVALMVLKKYDIEDEKGASTGLLADLYKQLDNDHYYLMRYRMYKLHGIFANKREIMSFMQRHEDRLRWHIDRIYRVRNKIVHAGKTPKYLSTLIENLHSYVDILIDQLLDDHKNLQYDDFRKSFVTQNYRYKSYMKMLEIESSSKKNQSLENNTQDLFKFIFNN